MSRVRTCVTRDGRFAVGIHRPEFEVKNFRSGDCLDNLGQLEDGTPIDNRVNFPEGNIREPGADIIYEISNAFPFRGTTYINSAWADVKSENPDQIGIPSQGECSFLKNYQELDPESCETYQNKQKILDALPRPLLLTLAHASTDPEELKLLAEKSCRIIFDDRQNNPSGIGYKKKKKSGRIVPDIKDHELFEIVVNNRHLPDGYKNILVLKPGVQGSNEITGEYVSEDGRTHVFEYLRRNSYIPWGHFASNMANDAVRYRASDLSAEDMKGIRRLYYQRIYARLASQVGAPVPEKRALLTEKKLEDIRLEIISRFAKQKRPVKFNAALWGWNFGFGYAGTGHRLHASHQMIHQQNAMIPGSVPSNTDQEMACFSCGDMIADFIQDYKNEHGICFFDNFIKAVKNNERTDGNREKERSLIVLEDELSMLFVPKAQVCEWELQLVTKFPCTSVLQADPDIRASLDSSILHAVQILERLGTQFVTSIEFSGRVDQPDTGQHLLYSFIPRLPYAPPTFSEAQMRWICGLYPEDFASACRKTFRQIREESPQ